VNCLETPKTSCTTAWAGRPSARVKKQLDCLVGKWEISSQAPRSCSQPPGEGSTTIPSGSRAQAGSKCVTPFGVKIWSDLARERKRVGAKRPARNESAPVRQHDAYRCDYPVAAQRGADSRQCQGSEPQNCGVGGPPAAQVVGKHRVNCLEPPKANCTTAWTGRSSAKVKKQLDSLVGEWEISSQAPRTGEGSTIIPKGSRARASSKRMATQVVEDMISSSVKAEESWQKRPARKETVTISGRPVEIVALEAFRVVLGTPAGITPTVSLYATVILEGSQHSSPLTARAGS